MVSQAVVVATGVAAGRNREVLGFDVVDSEDGRVLHRVPAVAEGPRRPREWQEGRPNPGLDVTDESVDEYQAGA